MIEWHSRQKPIFFGDIFDIKHSTLDHNIYISENMFVWNHQFESDDPVLSKTKPEGIDDFSLTLCSM